MAKKPNDYMGSGERERILGTGMARNAGKAAVQHNQTKKNRLDDIMNEIGKTRGR
jgi:hypothetical protein